MTLCPSPVNASVISVAYAPSPPNKRGGYSILTNAIVNASSVGLLAFIIAPYVTLMPVRSS